MKHKRMRGFIAKVVAICMLLSLLPINTIMAEESTTPQLQLTVGGQNSVTTWEDAGVWINASYTDATYTDSVATWEVDDASVVEIREKKDNGCQIHCLKTGNAVITATTEKGLTATIGVTVRPIDETTKVTNVTEGSNAVKLTQNQNTYISFTPDDDGDYLFVSSGFSVESVANLEHFWSHAGEGNVFELKAGNTYKFRICSESDTTENITVTKVTNYSSKIILQDWEKQVREFMGHNTSYGYELEAGTIDRIYAVAADPNVVKVDTDGQFVMYEPVGPGETTVTLTTKGGGSAVVDVIVYDVVNGGALTAASHDVKLLQDKGTEFTFTAPADGKYWVYFSREIPVVDHAIWGATQIDDYTTSKWHGIVWNMEKNQELTMILRAEEGDIDTQVGVQAVDYADDFIVNGGNDATGIAETSIKIPVEAVGGNVFRNLNASVAGETADGEPIAQIDWNNPNSDEIELWLQNVGKATLTVTLDGNITKTIDIDVTPYRDSVLNYWNGTQNGDTTLYLEFTAPTTGWYYLHYDNYMFYGNQFEIAGDENLTAKPEKSFEYSKNHYSGKVYWLEADEKYVFESYSNETRDYEVYIDDINIATGFTVDTPTLSGDIDEQVELKLSHNGVLVFEEIVSSNKEVVVAGSWSYDETGHSYNVFLLGEGTATLTMTDIHGNTETCTVTVSSNKLPTQVFTDNGDHAAWDEMGLASGESVTYSFTPETTGYYWIFSELNKDLGIVVTDPSDNNNVVNGKPWIARESNGKSGYIYEMTGGNTYYVTFSSTEAMSTFVVADRMYEATGLDGIWGLHEYWANVGDTGEICYNLMEEVEHYWSEILFTEIEAESSNPDVVEITSIENNKVTFSFVGDGEAVVTVKLFGETYSTTVHVSSPAEDIEINDGKDIIGEAGTRVKFPYTLIGGNEISGFEAQTDRGDVARVNRVDWEKRTIEIAFGNELGETTLFVWADGIEQKEYTITNTEYGVSLPKWEGTAEAGEPMVKTFTPADGGGWYFIHHYCWGNGYEITPIVEEGADEIPSFFYQTGDYEGVVYYLTEETSFELVCYGGGEVEYKIYISEMEIADSFDMPETLEGSVHENLFVEVVPGEGAFDYEVSTDNPEVVITGHWGRDGFTVYLIGEGEANITVTSTLDNTVKKTCKVTVAGKLDQQILEEETTFGLAAGDSIRYDYHASREGLYWILKDEPAFELAMTDSNDASVVQYAFNASMQDCYGVVVSLSENEIYELTVENPANEALYTSLMIMYVEEADGVRLPEHVYTDREGSKGKEMFLPYELYAAEGDQLVVSNTIKVTSSNTDIATIGEKEFDGVWVNLVGLGETEIVIEVNDAVVTYHVVVRDYADDFTLNNGNALTGVEGSVVTFPVTLIGGTELGFRDIWVENPPNGEPIAEFNHCTEDTIAIRFLNAGTAILHIDTTNEDMEHKTFELTTTEYGLDLVSWKGTQAADTDLSMEYTPENDGWYFMHERNERGEAARLSEELEQTITWFDYDENGYWGRVFYLEGGETYEFMSRTWEEREYAFYIKEVTVPDSFTVTSRMEGKINESRELEIIFNGALATDVETDNPDVVLLGGGDARFQRVFLVGEGTATITVTDFRGNKQYCQVTVSDEVLEPQPLQEWMEIGLVAGGSITYTFTPESTGDYWIYGMTPDEFKVTVKDEDGATVSGYRFYASNEDHRQGSVFSLTEGEQYEITFRCTEMFVSAVGYAHVKEATGIVLEGDNSSYEGAEGDVTEIYYCLTGEETILVAPISVESSDPNVVKAVSVEKNFTRIQLMGGGTATITISVGTESITFDVTATELPEIKIDEEFSVTLEPGESTSYTFTPDQNGTYVLSRNIGGDLFGSNINHEESSFWTSASENKCGFIYYNLKAGEKYVISFNHPDFASGAATNAMKMEKTGPVTHMDLSESTMQIREGSEICVQNVFSSYLEMEDPVEWSLKDANQNEVDETYGIEARYIDATEIVLYFPYAGTYTLTATCGSFTASCVITVMGVQDATGVEIKADNADLPMFCMTNVTITPTPANGDLADYKVTISDPDVVEVSSTRSDEFTLFGRGEGTATVTITLKNGVTDSFDITVFKYDPITLNYEYEFEFNRWEGIGYGFTPDSDCGYRVEMTSDNLAMVHVRNPLIGYEEILEVSGGSDSMVLDVEAGVYYVIDMTNQYSDDVAKGTVKLVPDHALTKIEAKAATCTKDGNIEHYTCEDCGKYYADAAGMLEITEKATVVPAAHKLDKIEAVEATCTTPGNIEYYKCSVCEKRYDDANASNELTVDIVLEADHKLETVEAVEATCTTSGNIEHYKCSVCENLYEDIFASKELSAADVVVEAGHKYVLFDAKPATCTEKGNVDYFECSVCEKLFDGNKNEATEEEIFIKAAHGLSKVEAVEATCTTAGNIEHYKCSVCEKLYDDADASNELSEAEVVVEAAHTLSKVAAVAATCTTDGNIEHYKCSVCEKLYDDADASNELSEAEVVVEAGHTLSKVAAVAATCTTAGNIEHYKCSVCEKLYDDAEASNELSEADVVVEASHTLSKVAAKAATCTTDGNIEHYKCSVCEKLYDDAEASNEFSEADVVVEAGHTLSKVAAKAATCTTDGNIEHYKCSVCEKLYDDAEASNELSEAEVVVEAGHKLDKVAAKAATCTTDGNIEHYKCSVCEKLYDDAEASNELSGADVVVEASHTLSKVAAKAATCTTDGNIEHYKCSVCEKLYDDAEASNELSEAEVVVEAGHTLSKVGAVAATCTTTGKIQHYTCEKCNKIFVDAEGLAETTSEALTVAKTSHKLTKVNEVAATCTVAGTKEHYTCNTCKQLFADASGQTVATAEGLAIAPSHTINKVAAKAATCTAAGTKEHYACDGCQKLYADVSGTTELTAADVLIAASHTLTKVDTVEATCTAAGVAEHYVCGPCGKLYTDANATTEVTAADIAIASAHNIKKVDAVEADYTKPGNVEHYSCDACGKLFSDAEGTSVITDVTTPQLVKVEDATADITQDVIDKAVADAEETGEVNIDLSEAEEVSEIELPAKALKELAEAEKPLTISTPQATVTFDAKTLETIAAAAGEGTISLQIEEVETKTLNKKQKQAIADIEKDGVAVLVTISANLYSGDEYIGDDFNGGKAEVKVPLKLEEGENGEEYSVLYVDDNGKMWPVECSYKNGHLHFITGHFSEYVIVKAESTEFTNPEGDKDLDNDSEKNTFGKELVFGIVILIVMCAVIGVVISKKRKNGKQQK